MCRITLCPGEFLILICNIFCYRRVHRMRQEHAATVIQRFVRGWVKRKQYHQLRCTILGIQRYGRGLLARRRYLAMRYNHAVCVLAAFVSGFRCLTFYINNSLNIETSLKFQAIVIQTSVRRWLCRMRYLKNRKRVIVAQSAVRRFLAKRRFKAIKRDARSVEHVKKLNKGLENKIISLQQRIGELVSKLCILLRIPCYLVLVILLCY